MTKTSKIAVAKANKGLANMGVDTSTLYVTYDADKMEFSVNGQPVGYFDGLYNWAKSII